MEDLALAVGSGKVRGGSSSVWEEGIKRAGPQRERDGGDSFLATADSIKQQYRTAFCALKHICSSFKPAIYYVDSGLSFDASSEVYGGEDLALAVGNGKFVGGSCSVLGAGVKRAGSQRERDGGDSFLATADSIKQQYRTAFCALKHTRSSYKPDIFMDSGFSFDASSEVYGGEDMALAVGSGKLMGGRGSVLGKGVKRAGSHRESETAGTLSLPRPIPVLNSNTAQPSAR